MTVLIDNGGNYSMTLQEYLRVFDPDVRVLDGKDAGPDAVAALAPGRLVIASGPAAPGRSVLPALVRQFAPQFPILGIGIGHLAVAAAFGGRIVPSKAPTSGRQANVTFDVACPIFRSLPRTAPVGLIRTLAVSPQDMPGSLAVTAVDENNEITALMHREYPVYGVAFEPASLLTPNGKQILELFTKIRYY
ncbi:MAG: hypothetical protein IJK02_00855 [Clostridia bacterium]|nr:hypothetical protein [Clostridia bacterium]